VNILPKWASKFQHSNAHHSISKMTHVVCTRTHDINPSVDNFYVPIPKEMDNCKELAKILSSHKQITSPPNLVDPPPHNSLGIVGSLSSPS